MRAAASLLLSSVLLCASASADELVAVLPLDLRNSTLDAAARLVLEEAIRTESGRLLTPLGYTVLTGDTTLAVLSDNGVDAARACEASCALEAARELKATLFVSGSFATAEGVHVGYVRLHEVSGGRQLGAVELRGRAILEVQEHFKREAAQLFASVPRRLGAALPGPKEGRIVARTDASAPAPEEVVVRFESDPPGAVVMLDGSLLCPAAPCSKQITAGPHDALAQKQLYEDARRSFYARRGDVVRLTLAPTFGTLVVRTRPAGVQVSVDGEKLPATGEGAFAPGVRAIVVDDPCWLPDGERVSLAKGGRREVELVARPRVATVKVSAADEKGDALEPDVHLDGAPMGRAPGTFEVPICAKQLELRTPSGGYWSTALALKEGASETVAATMGAWTLEDSAALSFRVLARSPGKRRYDVAVRYPDQPQRRFACTITRDESCVLRNLPPGHALIDVTGDGTVSQRLSLEKGARSGWAVGPIEGEPTRGGFYLLAGGCAALAAGFFAIGATQDAAPDKAIAYGVTSLFVGGMALYRAVTTPDARITSDAWTGGTER